MNDRRDPTALGEALLAVRELHPRSPLSAVYDRSTFRTPDHKADPSPLEKYGDPRTLPTTLPN